MTDPRDQAVTAIRTVLASVPGLWPVQYDGEPLTPTPTVPFLAEQFVFGPEDDAAVGKTGGLRCRESTENYQLELRFPVGVDKRTATSMGHTIARKFLDTTISLASGDVLWFTQYRLTPRGIDSGWQKLVLVLTYRYIYYA